MNFKDAIKKLNIEDYGERIFNSNSRGELFHLKDYILIAETIEDTSWFREWFIAIVKEAEEKWERPESIFQHILKLLTEEIRVITAI
jgi:hypothetical protein